MVVLSGQGGEAALAAAELDGGPPAWALHLHGRILEPTGDTPAAGSLPTPQPFSHYLRSLSVQLTAVPVAAVRSAPIRRPVAAAPRAFGSKSRLVRLPHRHGKAAPSEPSAPPVLPPLSQDHSKQQVPHKDAVQSKAGDDSQAANHTHTATGEAGNSKAVEAAVDTTTWSAAQQAGPPRSAFVIR